MMKIVEFFIKRPKVVNLILVFILLMGALTIKNLQKQGAPSVDYGFVRISTVYPGASPEDVELKVTNKIEDELKSVDGIKRLTSRSLESFSIVAVELDDSVDYKKTKEDIKKAVDRVQDLPKEVEAKPYIIEINSDTLPLVEVAITGTANYGIKRVYAKALENKFRENKLVGGIDKFGYLEKEIKIEVDQKKLLANYISLGEVMSAIEAHNFRMSAGDLNSKFNEKKFLIMSEFENPKDVGKVIIRSGFEGNRVIVSDVARIVDGYEKAGTIIKTDGNKSINMTVKKKPAADIMNASVEMRQIIKDFQKDLPENVQISLVVDFSVEVKSLLDMVISNAWLGFVLVLLTLLVLLNFKIAFWTALGIPISIMLSLSLFPVFGVTINFISLMGLILVLGMIVDDAIIVGENIYHYREEGLPPMEAAQKGVQEVLWPVITTILTTVVVFLPMMAMKGILGKFMFQMPIAVALILFSSLAECLFILPSHISHTKIKKKDKKKKTWFGRFENKYEKFIIFTINNKYKTTLTFIGIFILSIIVMITSMKFVLFPSDDGMYAYITYETAQGTSLEETSKKAEAIEEALKPYLTQGVSKFVTTVGEHIPQVADFGTNYSAGFVGNIMIHLTPMGSRNRTATDIVSDIKKDIEGIKGFTKLDADILSDGPPVGEPITVTLISDNDDSRNAVFKHLKNYLANLDGVKDIVDNEGKGKKRIDISLDYDLMSRLGLNAISVANTIRTAFQGIIVSELRWNGEDIDYRVILNKEARTAGSNKKAATLRTIKSLTVQNHQGKLIPLGQLIKATEKDDLLKINHFDADRSVTIYADVDLDKITSFEANQKIKKELKPLTKQYPALRVKFGGEEQDTQEAMSSLFSALILALVGIYFILVVLFNSFTQPFLVMTAIPFSLSGVIFTFWSHNLPMSFPAMIGLIGLTGIVVNDSLVMISFLNTKRDEAGTSIESMAAGAKRRLRPILLTTTTTAAGLFPTAYAFGGDNPFIVPMILTIAWGLVFATIITLILVPSLYVIQHNFNARVKKMCTGCEVKTI